MYKAVSVNKRNTVLILLVFLLIIAGLGALAGVIYQNWWITVAVVVFAGIYAFIQYFAASRIAISVNGGREVSKRDAPELYRIVENLAISRGMPTPRVFVIDDPSPNAFATGRNPKHAYVAATTGLLNLMDKRELEAVMAHEMGHVENYDILVNMIVFGLVSAIGMLSDLMLRIFLYSDSDSDNKNPIMFIFGLIGIILAPLVAFLVQMAVSRQREFLADATGALTTRDPEGLAMALEKLKTASQPMKKQNTATAHLFFANPLKPGFFSKIFSTHPPLDDRIQRLRDNAEKM